MKSKLALQGGEGEGGAARLAVTPAALRQLEAYTWPGNISVRVGVIRVNAKAVTPFDRSKLPRWLGLVPDAVRAHSRVPW